MLRERLGHGYQDDPSTPNVPSRPCPRRPARTSRGCLNKGNPNFHHACRQDENARIWHSAFPRTHTRLRPYRLIVPARGSPCAVTSHAIFRRSVGHTRSRLRRRDSRRSLQPPSRFPNEPNPPPPARDAARDLARPNHTNPLPQLHTLTLPPLRVFLRAFATFAVHPLPPRNHDELPNEPTTRAKPAKARRRAPAPNEPTAPPRPSSLRRFVASSLPSFFQTNRTQTCATWAIWAIYRRRASATPPHYNPNPQ